MSLRKKQSIFAQNVGKLIAFAYENCYELTLGEAQRTIEQQRIYVETGASKTMRSNHLNKMAIDLNVFIDGRLTYEFEDIKPLGDYWESLHPHNRWGGDWNKNDKKDGWLDTPHFEMQNK